MVNKYVHLLETREINPRTGEIWRVSDVPSLWYDKVIKKIQDDGYVVMDDGTVTKELK